MFQNEAITEGIKALKAHNEGIRKHSKELEEGNRLMRNELSTLQSQLAEASAFASATLKSTSDSQARDVSNLQTGSNGLQSSLHERAKDTPKVEVQDDDGDEDDNDDENHDESKTDEVDDKKVEHNEENKDEDVDDPSFLELGASVSSSRSDEIQMADAELTSAGMDSVGLGETPAASVASSNPQDMVGMLSSGIANLAKEERAGEAKLKSMFLVAFRAGAQRRATLLAQQQSLNASRHAHEAVEKRLQRAEKHLEATREELQHRLHSLGTFVLRLARLAQAKPEEVPQLMKSLGSRKHLGGALTNTRANATQSSGVSDVE